MAERLDEVVAIFGSIRRVEQSYDVRGKVSAVTCYNNATVGSGSVVNQVTRQFNGFGQVTQTFQAHSGAVNASTTPSVGASFTNGCNNTLRPTGTRYPDGRTVAYGYGSSGSIDDFSNRVATLTDDGSTVLAEHDWLYRYDGLHRLQSADRGHLNTAHSAIQTLDLAQCWTLDPTGNWSHYRQDDNGNGTWDLIQDRTANTVNEITDIDNLSGTPWATPAYDKNGNSTSIPRPDLGSGASMTATYDAWNDIAPRDSPLPRIGIRGYRLPSLRDSAQPAALCVTGDSPRLLSSGIAERLSVVAPGPSPRHRCWPHGRPRGFRVGSSVSTRPVPSLSLTTTRSPPPAAL